MRRSVALLALAALVGCMPAAAGSRKVTLMLDWTPNPDHVGLYEARESGRFDRAGLDVTIRAPSDPTAPLKLVGAGRIDLAVSYEQELFFAAAKRLPVIAVAAVVPQPLNSFMSIGKSVKSLRDLKGRSVGITGVPSDYAILDTALRSVGLTRKSVKVVNVGYNLLPALLAHRVDAVLGVYRNVEGIQLRLRGFEPTIIPVDRAGVPTYDELVLVANKKRLDSDSGYRSMVKRVVGGLLTGTAAARSHPGRAESILKKVTASDDDFLKRATPATLRLLAGPHGVGCVDVAAWGRFGAWMHRRNLLKRAIPAKSVVTARLLPKRCRAA